MTKIVYNTTFGGFSLSLEAMRTYARLRNMVRDGLMWRVETKGQFIDGEPCQFWLERRGYSDPTSGHPDYREDNSPLGWEYVSASELDRADPILVEAVGQHRDANPDLAIRELPEGTRYVIREYDGMEDVVTIDQFDWKVA